MLPDRPFDFRARLQPNGRMVWLDAKGEPTGPDFLLRSPFSWSGPHLRLVVAWDDPVV